MTIHQDVIAGLRRLFIRGTTYSGLLRYLMANLDEHEATTFAIQQHLMEAFAVPFFAPVKKNVAEHHNDDYYASINAWLIPRILATRATWLTDHSEAERAWWRTQTLTASEE